MHHTFIRPPNPNPNGRRPNARWHMHTLLTRLPLVGRLVAHAASVAGLLGLAFTLKPLSEWGLGAVALLAIAAVATVVLVALEIASDRGRTVFGRTNQRAIRDYMFHWIENGGPVAIWTRDHSWINDDEMRALLLSKASKRELTLCVPGDTKLTRELEDAGADIVRHGYTEPSIRFTIVNYSQESFQVALARPGAREHVIEEYAAPHPVAALARDLVELAKARRVEP